MLDNQEVLADSLLMIQHIDADVAGRYRLQVIFLGTRGFGRRCQQPRAWTQYGRGLNKSLIEDIRF
ncbi:hypothetical protein QT990_31420 [Microcoleus sp. T3_B1]|uniref:hypothetical protein n=1 Tax=Microcoleus sp. T3_B1 TaxID=3055425 RepID=UPI002FD3D1B2